MATHTVYISRDDELELASVYTDCPCEECSEFVGEIAKFIESKNVPEPGPGRLAALFSFDRQGGMA